MTREELIEQKAKELGQKYFPDKYNIWARANYEAQYVESACKEMVEWADEHPDLYSVTRKVIEREREYMINKACERLRHLMIDKCIFQAIIDLDKFIKTFHKEMEEQQ